VKQDSVIEFPRPSEVPDVLSQLLRAGAQRLIEQAVEVELQDYLGGIGDRRWDGQGRRAVVRNGYLPQRQGLTGIGPVPVQVPKVRDRSGEGAVFHSKVVPPYVRRSRSVEAALPWLYLHGVSTGDMSQALAALVGPQAAGLSAAVVSRLKAVWKAEYDTWRASRLDKDRWVYLWADGIYSGLRGESERLCVLVIIGVNERGQKRFLAIEDGVRESKHSWKDVLHQLKERGLRVAPKLAVGDGALGFWGALWEVFPTTVAQRCWVHKMVNVLNYLPKSVQPKAKSALHEIWMAETKAKAQAAFDRFVAGFRAKYPKAVECLLKDRETLLAFYDFPAEHWVHIRSTNVIESAFATIRHRSDRAKGCVSRDSMLSMVFKLGMNAQLSWRRLRGFELLAQVIAGVTFRDGLEQPLPAAKTAARKREREHSRVAA
jgi:transposase-like protein